MPPFPFPLPDDEQKRRLCLLASHAFVRVRALAVDGERAAIHDLADAFHNLTSEIWGLGTWSPELTRLGLDQLRRDHPHLDFVAAFDAVFELRPPREGTTVFICEEVGVTAPLRGRYHHSDSCDVLRWEIESEEHAWSCLLHRDMDAGVAMLRAGEAVGQLERRIVEATLTADNGRLKLTDGTTDEVLPCFICYSRPSHR